MEVILLEHVEKLGSVGDCVNVKNGYARNFLLPRGKALRANNENKAIFEQQRASIEAENNKRKAEAEKQAQAINETFVLLIRQAGEDGRLYGSANARDIAGALAEAKIVEVTRNQVSLPDSIKYLGVYPVKISLHPEVSVQVNVNVARSEEEAEDAKKEFLNPKPKEESAANVAEVKEAVAEETGASEELVAENVSSDKEEVSEEA